MLPYARFALHLSLVTCSPTIHVHRDDCKCHTQWVVQCQPHFIDICINTTGNICVKSKAIPVTGRGDQWGCETSRFQYLLDNRPRDGHEVVSLTHRSRFTSEKCSVTHFCQRLSELQDYDSAGRIK
jgi:hypothetical protein